MEREIARFWSATFSLPRGICTDCPRAIAAGYIEHRGPGFQLRIRSRYLWFTTGPLPSLQVQTNLVPRSWIRPFKPAWILDSPKRQRRENRSVPSENGEEYRRPFSPCRKFYMMSSFLIDVTFMSTKSETESLVVFCRDPRCNDGWCGGFVLMRLMKFVDVFKGVITSLASTFSILGTTSSWTHAAAKIRDYYRVDLLEMCICCHIYQYTPRKQR